MTLNLFFQDNFKPKFAISCWSLYGMWEIVKQMSNSGGYMGSPGDSDTVSCQ